MSNDFYLPDAQIQQLLQEYFDASQSVRDLTAYQTPAQAVHGSEIANPRMSRAAVYGPDWMNPPSVLSPSVNSVQPQRQLMEELMAQQIRRDSAVAGLQLQRPGFRAQVPLPQIAPPQSPPTPGGLAGARALSPVLMFLDLLTQSTDLNKGEDEATGRATDVKRGTAEKERRAGTSMQLNQQKLLQLLHQAVTPNR